MAQPTAIERVEPLQERLLSVRDVAQRLSVSERWVTQMIRDGKLCAVRLGNSRRYRVRDEDLEKFVKENPASG